MMADTYVDSTVVEQRVTRLLDQFEAFVDSVATLDETTESIDGELSHRSVALFDEFAAVVRTLVETADLDTMREAKRIDSALGFAHLRLALSMYEKKPAVKHWLAQIAAVVEMYQQRAGEIVAVLKEVDGVPGELRQYVDMWLETHLPDRNAGELFGFLRLMTTRPQLRSFALCVQEFAARVEFAKLHQQPDGAAETLGATVANMIQKAAPLKAIHDPALLDAVRNGYRVLDEVAFNAMYANAYLAEHGAHATRFAAAALVDRLLGFHHRGVMYVRGPRPDFTTGLHEAMHMLSWQLGKSAWHTSFGGALEEAAAEYMTRLVHRCASLSYGTSAYMLNVDVLERIAEFAHVDEAELIRAYFEGHVGPVEESVRRMLSPALLNRIVNAPDKMLHTTYGPWIKDVIEHMYFTPSGIFGRVQNLGASVWRDVSK